MKHILIFILKAKDLKTKGKFPLNNELAYTSSFKWRVGKIVKNVPNP